jgi:hypothetical protein
MSDIYLELVSRIPVVAQRTTIGRARLGEAQERVGLSNEAIARRVPVSEKTWRRWKEKGEIPTASLPAVASALRLELRELEPPPEVPATTPDAEELAAVMGTALNTQREVLAILQAVAAAVDAQGQTLQAVQAELDTLSRALARTPRRRTA